MSEAETYEKPRHGWTCFHCGETFRTAGNAKAHFGEEPSAVPACRIKAGAERGLLMELRKVEEENARLLLQLCDEWTEAHKIVAQQASRHQRQLQEAEEMGYERGLRDGLALTPEERHKMYAEA